SPLLEELKNPSTHLKGKENETQKSPNHSISTGKKRSTSNPNSNLRQRFENLKRLLSIDGGGIRGLIPAILLHDLEQAVMEALSVGDYHYDAFIADYFDVFAGTSTGG